MPNVEAREKKRPRFSLYKIVPESMLDIYHKLNMLGMLKIYYKLK